MNTCVNVKMKAAYIYDLLLFHVYSKFSGFLVNLLGLTVLIIGGLRLGKGDLTLLQASLYVIGGMFILAYTPFTLKRQAKRMMKNMKYENELAYRFDHDGIHENLSGGKETCYAWEQIKKAIATPKTISFYITETDALIIPKECFGDTFGPIMNLVIQHMTMDRIYIR
ncbi:MAG: YcxB family protein [Lachnospiraceae bacterium]|nr:YcxB family protein [Lachnospiraceae bacterium]